MMHFTPAVIDAAIPHDEAFDIMLDAEISGAPGDLFAEGPIEALPIEEFYFHVDVTDAMTRTEQRRSRKGRTKSRDLERHAQRRTKQALRNAAFNL